MAGETNIQSGATTAGMTDTAPGLVALTTADGNTYLLSPYAARALAGALVASAEQAERRASHERNRAKSD